MAGDHSKKFVPDWQLGGLVDDTESPLTLPNSLNLSSPHLKLILNPSSPLPYLSIYLIISVHTTVPTSHASLAIQTLPRGLEWSTVR